MRAIRKCAGLLCAALLLTGAAGCKGDPEPLPITTATSAATVPQGTTTAAPTMPLRDPKTLGSMTMGSVYYKPEMAAAVYAVDTTRLSQSEIAMLRCLQGLVARTESAAIYLMETESDRFWNTHTAEEYGTVFKEATTQKLLEKYGKLIKTLVYYDEKQAYQYPVAQSLASLKDGLAVPSALADVYNAFFEDAIAKGAMTTTDLSNDIKSAAGAITWAEQNLLGQCSSHYIGVTDMQSGVNDYLYATQALCVMADPADKTQVAALKKILAYDGYTDPPILMSTQGDFSAVAAPYNVCCQSFEQFANVTFFASFPANSKMKDQPSAVDRGAKEGVTYVAICIDSCGVACDTTQMDMILNHPVRGSTPIGVALNPSLCELAPPMMRWYSGSRGASTIFVSGSFGYSELDANRFSREALQSWLLTNNTLLARSKLDIVTVHGKLTDETAQTIAQTLRATGYLCSSIDTSKIIEGVPFIKTIALSAPASMQNPDFILPGSSEDAPQFLCLTVKAEDLDENLFDVLEQMILNYQRLNSGTIEFLQIHDLVETMAQYHAEQAQSTEKAVDEHETTQQ